MSTPIPTIMAASLSCRGGSEQLPGVIQKSSIHKMSFFHQLMMLGRTSGIDVLDVVSMCGEVIRNEHAVALEPHALSAHDGRRGFLGECSDFGGGGGEWRSEHVIRVIPKGVVAESGIRRIVH